MNFHALYTNVAKSNAEDEVSTKYITWFTAEFEQNQLMAGKGKCQNTKILRFTNQSTNQG